MDALQEMAQHEIKAIDRIGMQTIGIFEAINLMIECEKGTEDPSMSNNLFFFSIGLLYHESQGLWYIKTLPFRVEPSLGVSYEK